MPKMTAKYSVARRKAAELNIPLGTHQEEVYQALNSQWWYWNSKEKIREFLEAEADPPTQLIRVRIWADSRFIEQAANDCIESLASKGLALVEKSEIHPCRPPKQLEARIYLALQKKSEKEAVPRGDDAVLSRN